MRHSQPENTPSANLGLFLLRVALFTVFITHGSQKMFGWFGGSGFQGTLAHFIQVQHIPTFFAVLAILTEFFGSLALLFGLFTRLAALGLGCIIVVAALTVHLKNGFFMNWAGTQRGEGIEFFILAAAIVFALITMGAGDWSLDALISRRIFRTRRTAPLPA